MTSSEPTVGTIFNCKWICCDWNLVANVPVTVNHSSSTSRSTSPLGADTAIMLTKSLPNTNLIRVLVNKMPSIHRQNYASMWCAPWSSAKTNCKLFISLLPTHYRMNWHFWHCSRLCSYNFIHSHTWFVAGMLDISVRETVRRKTSQAETKRSGHGNFTQFCQTIGTLQASKGNAQPFNVNTIYSI